MNVLKQENFARAVLPGVALPLGKNGDYLVDYFKQHYDINIDYLESVKTVTRRGAQASRMDQIFNVKENSIDQFNQYKTDIGAKYAKDIVRDNEHHVYKERVFLRYFKRFEDELIKSGDLSKEDAYKTL